MRDSLSGKNTKVGPDVCWSRIKQAFDSFLPRSILPSSSSSSSPSSLSLLFLHFTVLKSFQPKNTGVKKEKFDKAESKTEKRSVFRKRKRKRKRKRGEKEKKILEEEEKEEEEEFSFTTNTKRGRISRREDSRFDLSILERIPVSLSLLTSTSTLPPPPPPTFSPSSFSSAFDSPPFLLLLLPSSPSPVFFSFLFSSFLFPSLACFAKSPHGRKRHVQLWNKNVATSNAITRELREQLQNADAVLEVRERRTRGRREG